MAKSKKSATPNNLVYNAETEQYEILPGEKDAPPLEMTEELEVELLEGEREKEEKKRETRKSTEHYSNGKQEWKLLTKTWNEVLGWEHTTTVMQLPTGVLFCVKEAIGQKADSTTTFVPGLILSEINGKIHIAKGGEL